MEEDEMEKSVSSTHFDPLKWMEVTQYSHSSLGVSIRNEGKVKMRKQR